MNSKTNPPAKRSNPYIVTILVLSSLCYHAIIGLQGFDMADEGWSLTGFQQIFHAPESIEYLMMYYLTNIVGGVWNSLFGWGGIYAFRLLTGVVVTATVYVVFRMLRPYFSPWSIVLGIWASFFCSYYGIMVFYHNYLTALLAVCASSALFKSLMQDDVRWMAVCGFLIGCTIFVRLPNITLTAFILLFIPYYLYHKNIKSTLKLCLSACTGFLIAVCAVLLFMVVMGHDSIFFQAISSGFSAVSNSESNHQIGQMVGRYLSNYQTIFTLGYFNNTYTVYLVGTLGWVWILFFRRHRPVYVYLSTIAMIMLHCLPLGSDFGIGNMGENCVYLATPLITGIVWKEIHESTVPDRRKALFRVSTIILLGLFILRGMKQMMGQCYFDEGSRIEKTCRIDHPLATTLTTEKNCRLLEPLLQQLSEYVDEDDYLLCFQNNPTIHFLTKTRPYLYNPWVWSYDPDNMERQFLRAEQENPILPVIVRDKSLPPHWYELDPDWDNEHTAETYFHKNKKIRLIHQFIQRHHYKVVWENEVFQLLIPQE